MPRPSAVAIALGVLCLGALGIATNIATSALPPAWSPYLWLAWLAMPVLLGAAAVIEVRRSQGDRGNGGVDNPRARAALLKRVHHDWVRGMLEQPLYQEARIELGMTLAVDASPPWDVGVVSPDGSSRVLLAGTTMAEVFDKLDETMLVLGTPGSGKTTMMAELACELLRRANTNSQNPIPVVLMLSSWTLPREPLVSWIVHELAEHYRIPTAQASHWLNTDQLILLLDGLDEVAEEHQQACVRAINNFHAERGVTRIVVCCRTTEYERLREPLRTYGTLTIQPFTRKQIEDFLARAGDPVAAVRAALATDSMLWELIQSPLLLSIAVLAYRNAAIGTVATGGDSQQLRNQLFTTYVRTMLKRRRSDQHSARQTVRWLAFLADRMQRVSQTVFTLELLDKEAVRSWTGSFVPPTARSSLACRLAGGLVLGAAGLTAYGWRGGLAGAAVGLLHVERIDTRGLRYYRRTRGQGQEAWSPEARIGRIRGWFFNFFRFDAGEPGSYLDALPVTAGVAATVGFFLGSSNGLVSVLTYGTATLVAVLTAVILCIGYGHTIRDMQSVAPREGSGEVPSPIAKAVLQRGVLAAPPVALVTSILPGLLVAWPGTSADGYRFAAVVAIGAAMLALVWLGGFAVVEQAMVRFTLRKLDLAPLPLRPFLDYATQCLFLRQVGDGYLFENPSLLEFFAEMWEFGDVRAKRLDELTHP